MVQRHGVKCAVNVLSQGAFMGTTESVTVRYELRVQTQIMQELAGHKTALTFRTGLFKTAVNLVLAIHLGVVRRIDATGQ